MPRPVMRSISKIVKKKKKKKEEEKMLMYVHMKPQGFFSSSLNFYHEK